MRRNRLKVSYVDRRSENLKKIFTVCFCFLLVGCSKSQPAPDTEPVTTGVPAVVVVETQAAPETEETTQPTEPDLPWDPDARWYGTYYFEKRPNPDPNIVEGVVRFNARLRNEGEETQRILSAHGDFYLGTELVAQEEFGSNQLKKFFFHPGVGDLEMECGESKVFQLYSTEQEVGSYDRAIITYTIADPDGNETTQTFHFAVNAEDVTPYSTFDREDWSPIIWLEDRCDMYCLLQNKTDTEWKLVGFYTVNYLGGLPMSDGFFDKSAINREAAQAIETLFPGEMIYYQDSISHQYNTYDEKEVTAVYKDDTGKQYLQTFRFALDEAHSSPDMVSLDSLIYEERGVQILNTPALLEQELGSAQYDREEIRKMIDDGLTLEELAEQLSTIYDVQQFFLEAGIEFKGGDIKKTIGGTRWHFNDSPQVVFQQNYGNCGSGSNLINFLLRGDYDEQGFFYYGATSSGHIFNYFRSGDRYYIFDWANKLKDCFVVYAADSLEAFSDAYISFNHATESVKKEYHILLLYAYPYEGSHRPQGDSNVKTPTGKPLMQIIPAEIQDTVKILYVEDDQYAPIFVEGPDISQWPKDAQ